MTKKEMKTLSKKSSKLWLKRNEPEALAEFIQIEEKIAHSKNREQADLVMISRAEFITGDFFSDAESLKISHFERAANWAEKALTFNPNFNLAVTKQKLPTEQALDTLDKKDSEALYWLAVSLGKWANLKGVSTVLKYKDKVKKMIDRVAILNPNYLCGAVSRYYGAYYALLPGMNQDDLKSSRKFFEKAIRQAPDYFANRVLFAEFYAKKVDDQGLFRKQLESVIKGNPRLLKELYPEQILEQNRAKKLLEGSRKP